MDVKLFLEYLPWLRKPDYYYEMKRGIEGWDEENISGAIRRENKDATPIKRKTQLI